MKVDVLDLVVQNIFGGGEGDGQGNTALHCASHHGSSEMVSLLLAAPGVRVFLQSNAGQSAMELAKRDSDVWHMLNEVVDTKRTFGALLLAFLHRGVSRSDAAGLAMRGLRDDRARAVAARLRAAWPGAGGGQG